MDAVVVHEYGGPEVMRAQQRETPVPGPGQLLVDVAAAGVNYMDVYAREGRPPYAGQLPFVPGAEGAGVVGAVGDGPSGGFRVGDRVAWTSAPASYAGQVLVPAGQAVRVPEGIDLQLAAAVMLQGMTAHYLCHDTWAVRPGDVAVVHAAAGGVGLLLTQMVKMRGGVAIAVTSSEEKAALARQAGADHVASYEDFGNVAREVSGGAGAAVVYDSIGKTTFDASLAALRPRGLMVLYGAASGPVPPFELQRLAAGGSLFITRPTLMSYIGTRDELERRAADIFGWIRDGKLSVRISKTYPLTDVVQAHRDLQSRRTTGKLLLLPS